MTSQASLRRAAATLRRRSQLIGITAATVSLSLVAAAAPGSQEASALDELARSSPAQSASAASATAWPLLDDAQPPRGTDGVVTLITGDEVTVTSASGGRQEIDIDAADRPAGSAPVAFTTVRDPEGSLHVIPSDAELLVAKGVLERDLFNVSWLLEQGYADAASPTLPLIVKYRSRASHATPERDTQDLPASTLRHTLESIDAAAVTVTKSNADAFWQSLHGQDRASVPRSLERFGPDVPDTGLVEASATFEAGVERIWLDRTVHVTLDHSVPQIGAPEVWQAGYDGAGVTVAVLDTGIDASHPDLAGKVLADQSFIAGQTVEDGHGHGTHVAATIAGTGDGSDGQRKGVAPGADLVIGKVCDNSGSCPSSSIIDGMEWAAESDATVVNMSLGGCCTDGTDPLSQALNQISAASDTLFVVSAGNDGPGAPTVGTPGTAEEALTVGAVDNQDTLAEFSSRGPRLGDGVIKPDITGPGVNIVAARAAGTSAGSPVDDRYTRLSGTSMATPHVAGAAALLAQAHPDWDRKEIKSALTSTAKPGDYTVYQQGTGRIDAARAFGQGVYASPATVHLGTFIPGGLTEPVTRSLTYTNDTAAPVALDLTLDVRDAANRPITTHGISLSTGQVTVPAHGTSEIAVQLDPEQAASGPVGAVAIATSDDGQTVTRTAVGYYQGPASHHLTVDVLDSTGEPAPDVEVLVRRVDDSDLLSGDPLTPREDAAVTDENGEAAFIVPEGIYDVSGRIDEPTTLTRPFRTTFAYQVEQRVTEGSTVTLDARRGVPLRPVTRAQTDLRSRKMNVSRVTEAGNFWQSQVLNFTPRQDQAWFATPTTRTRFGQVDFSQRWELYAPVIDLSAERRGPDLTLHPNYSPRPSEVGWLRGDKEYEVAFADVSVDLEGVPDGPGVLLEILRQTAEDLAGLEVSGKAVLLRIDPDTDLIPPDGSQAGLVRAGLVGLTSFFAGQILEQAGAAATVSYADAPGAIAVTGGSVREFGLSYEEGDDLRRLLASDPGASLRIRGLRNSPLVYLLHMRQPALPLARPEVKLQELVRVESALHHDSYGDESEPCCNTAVDSNSSFGPIDFFDNATNTDTLNRRQRVEYIGPVDKDVWWRRRTLAYSWLQFRSEDVFSQPERFDEVWNESPMYFGVPNRDRTELDDGFFWCAYCRDGDFFWVSQRVLLDGGTNTHYASRSVIETSGPATSLRVFKDGVEIPETTRPFGQGVEKGFEMDPEPAEYRVEQVDTVTPVSAKIMSPRVTTTWTFRSERPDPDYALKPSVYTCPFSPEENCAFQPLIMLDYDLGLDLANRAPAGRMRGKPPWSFVIEPYHVNPNAPSITSVEVSTSMDGGDSWQPARVTPGSHGRFRVVVRHPALSQTDGFVWLRVHAEDAAGNSVTQEVERAYGLR